MEKKINILLRQARMERGLTQEEVATELDMSCMSVYRWECGKRQPNTFQIERLCELFGKSAQELGWTIPEKKEPTPIGPFVFFDPSVPVGRPVLAGQRSLLKAMQVHCLAPPSRKRIVGLIGLPGCGKTAVAAALLAMPQMQQAFSGVLWATVGQGSSPIRHLQRWASLLGIDASLPDDLEEAMEILRLTIGTRRIVVVLDDLWELEDFLRYHIGAPFCQYILTTRQPPLAHKLCDTVYRPTPLTTTQALHLLSSALPQKYVSEFHPALLSVTAQVGNLPLALELAIGYLRAAASTDSLRRIQAAVSQLAHPACYLHNRGSAEQGSVFDAFHRSEQWLPVTARKALSCLATYFAAAPAAFSERHATEVLQTQDLHIQDLDQLLDAGLVEPLGESRYQIHPIVAAYARLESMTGLAESSAEAASAS